MILPRRIYDLGLTNKAVVVYCYLCNRADENGECYPAVKRIAGDLSISKSTVFRAFKEHEKNVLLKLFPRYQPNGARRSSLYRLMGEITKTDGANLSLRREVK